MRAISVGSLTAAALLFAATLLFTATLSAAQVELNGQTFTLPDGFTIEQVAGPPLVDRPVVADFDEQGRLYVCDSSGSNDHVEKQLAERPHRVVRLEDTKGTGHFDKATVFADKMAFLSGAMWRDGSLYVAAPPSIWKLTDTDGDGVADKREEWFKGKTLTGCANDLHGPYAGPDGWIYWTKGGFANQTYINEIGKPAFETRAAHIFRAKPDCSYIEPVITGGMDNPVGLAWLPNGELFFTATFVQHPAGGKRDGILHAIYGGVYGKVHDVIDDHPRTGPDLMPVMTHLGPAAPAGMCCYESPAWGSEYQTNLFVAQFNMHKVSRHVMEPKGATYITHDSDFVVSSSTDFHPTDIHEDADGSLLILDTGGWYKLCCPTSQLRKPDVLGAIYRVKKTNLNYASLPSGWSNVFRDPRGTEIGWAKLTTLQLADLLADSRPIVRRRACARLVKLGDAAIGILNNFVEQHEGEDGVLPALSALAQIGSPAALSGLRQGLNLHWPDERRAAANFTGLYRDHDAREALRDMLGASVASKGDLAAMYVAAAAKALGRIGDKQDVHTIISVLGFERDVVARHSLTYALIEIGNQHELEEQRIHGKPQAEMGTLIALDQMHPSRVTYEQAAPQLTSSNAEQRRIAWWVASHHREWADNLTEKLRQQVRLVGEANARLDPQELETLLAGAAHSRTAQQMLTDELTDEGTPSEERVLILKAIGRSQLPEAPTLWRAPIVKMIGHFDTDAVRQAVITAGQLKWKYAAAQEIGDALDKLARNTKTPADVRLQAILSSPASPLELSDELFTFVRQQLSPESPLANRSLAGRCLVKATLTAAQLKAVARLLETAGPFDVDHLLDALKQSTDPEIGLAIVEALEHAESKTSLRAESVEEHLKPFGPAVMKRGAPLIASLAVDREQQAKKLDTLLAALPAGDVRRGQAVFNSEKTSCTACHQIGYRGGNVGPDLSRVGAIRTDRDLLESIVFPSASFVRGYEPVTVTTDAGRVYNGVIREDTTDAILLATGPKEEVRVLKSEIESLAPSKVSVMPAGFDRLLSPEQLADLVAFLKTCK